MTASAETSHNEQIRNERAVLPHRAASLLVFAGIWAIVMGITDIVRAFRLRQLSTG